jgi:triosephosphate isomerase
MNTNLASAVELAEDIVARCADCLEYCDVAIFPPFPYLQAVGKALGHHQIMLGAQDVYYESNGAYTGEVSTDMLLDLDVEMVLCGHSERRHVIGETDEIVNGKLRAALDAGLHAVLCIGETMEQREADQTRAVNVHQLMAGLRDVQGQQMSKVVIAYEPVWAIGTGRTATPQDAQAVHRLIRMTLEDMYDVDLAGGMRIQYGGSVKPDNAAALFSQPDIDGFLVGGASLKPEQFAAIVQAATTAGSASVGGTGGERKI